MCMYIPVHVVQWINLRVIAPPCRCLPECDVESGQLLQLLYAVDNPHIGGARQGMELKTHSKTTLLVKLHVLKKS
jgi:hypothetical protein